MSRRRKPTVGGRRAGAGRKPKPAGEVRSDVRTVKLTPDEGARHDAAAGDQPWSDWIREAAELAIARGSTR
jgi:hypothetical protein